MENDLSLGADCDQKRTDHQYPSALEPYNKLNITAAMRAVCNDLAAISHKHPLLASLYCAPLSLIGKVWTALGIPSRHISTALTHYHRGVVSASIAREDYLQMRTP